MAGEALIGAAQDAAGRLNKNLVIAFVSNMMNDPVMDATQWQRAFFDAAAAGPDALVVAQQRDPLNTPATIGGLAFAAKLPAIAPWRAFAEAGGLKSYGANQAAAYARGAQQVAVVLRGAASPADIPVQQPEMELVVNAQAAAHIGITHPRLGDVHGNGSHQLVPAPGVRAPRGYDPGLKRAGGGGGAAPWLNKKGRARRAQPFLAAAQLER